MTVWLNHFQEFEKKRKGDNRIVCGFTCLDSGKPKRIKIRLPWEVKIPSDFVHVNNVGQVMSEIPKKFAPKVTAKQSGNYRVLEAVVKKEYDAIHSLPKQFQIGNYDKLLRFREFHPERKFEFSPEFEEFIKGKDEIELTSSKFRKYAKDLGFLTDEELENLPEMVWDIEKPLWKKDDERVWLKLRENILKADKKKGENGLMHNIRMNAVKTLEDRLTLDVPNVGEVKLWEKRFDARVTQIGILWKNCFSPEHEKKVDKVRELYCIDSEGLLDIDEINEYKIKKFKNEKDLIQGFIDTIHERKPVASSAHNGVYDVTQVRYAGDELKITFDPAIKDVKPRRDFVRFFFQRMKEDLVYKDSMWINAKFHPYLRQKKFSSLKLKDMTKFYGLDFTKSMSHDDLRICELEIIAGKTKEIRKNALMRMIDYAANDVDPVDQLIEKTGFYKLTTLLKRKALPFCTLTQIAFNPSCAEAYHDWKHLREHGNMRFYGYKQKMRQDETQIFKKRFPGMKRDMLDAVEINRKKVFGTHKNVKEIYLPLEEWVKGPIFKYAPEFKEVYEEMPEGAKMGFLQDLKALEKSIKIDYHFADKANTLLQKHNTLGISGAIRLLEEIFRDVRGDEEKEMKRLDRLEKRILWIDKQKGSAEHIERMKTIKVLNGQASMANDKNDKKEIFKKRSKILKEDREKRSDMENIRTNAVKILEKRLKKINENENGELLNKYAGSFKYLKNSFRSVYVALDGEGRALIRDTKKNLAEVDVPEEMIEESNLYLLRENAEKINGHLSKGQQRILKGFMTTFNTLETSAERIREITAERNYEIEPGLLYIFNKFKEKERRYWKFESDYGFTVDELRKEMEKGYSKLRDELDKYGAKVVEHCGDYLYVTGDDNMKESKHFYVVRELDSFEVEDKRKKSNKKVKKAA